MSDNRTMRAVRFDAYGPPDVLVLADVDKPRPTAKQVLVNVRVTGVHPWDTKLRRGLLQSFMTTTFPHIPGIDFAGVIAEVGAEVTNFAVGDAVFGRGAKTYADYAVASVDAVAAKPDGVSFEVAATLPVGAGTAWAAVFDAAGVAPGQTVLIHGGAGGVGMFAVQLAAWKGATVAATTSTANVEFVASLGASTVIDYTAAPFEDAVGGMDVVIDTVGGDAIERSWSVLKPGGMLVTIAGQITPEDAASHGVRTAPVNSQADSRRLEEIAALVSSGQLRAEIARTFPLERAGEAHALSETGHGRGRIALVLAGY